MNNNNLPNKDNYYIGSRIPIRGFGNENSVVDGLVLNHPEVYYGIYDISENGYIYSVMSLSYLKWEIRDGYPSVLLLTRKEDYSREWFYIKDLMAYSYIANASDYLERGWIICNIDGDHFNCNYRNIIFLDPKKDFTEN